jgi:hypothetical protein
VAETKRLSGRQFDPHLVEVFLAAVKVERARNLAEFIEQTADDRINVLPALQIWQSRVMPRIRQGTLNHLSPNIGDKCVRRGSV